MNCDGLPARACLPLVLLAVAAQCSIAQSLPLVPRLYAGEILFYRLDFSSSRNVKAEGPVSSPQSPPSATLAASGLLQVEIVNPGAAEMHLRTYYSERDAQTPVAAASDRMVEVTIASNGSASQIRGLDRLSVAQQFAWRDWLGRFTSAMTFPRAGLHAGQKWRTSEPETGPAPIAALSWSKQHRYVRDEPCPVSQTKHQAEAGAASGEKMCAVILVEAVLRQKSSPKNATPDDYKLRNLRTVGTASGKNETILYFERSSGVLVRSSEDAQQFMNVLVALTDGSNSVHYSLDAKSHSELVLLPDSAP